MNKVLNHNIRLIQYLMRSDKSDGTNFKRVCIDFTNLALITKSAKPGDIQVNFDHASAGKPPPGETVNAFDLVVYLESLTLVSIDAKRTLVSAAKKIHIPVMEFFLRAAIGDFTHSKNMRD